MKRLLLFAALLSTVAMVGRAQTQNVTLEVDMSNYAGPFTTVYLSGDFNTWSGTSNPMTDMGSGIWQTTVTMNQGNQLYKFTVDDWADQENFAAGTYCTVTDGGFNNRYLNLQSDTVLAQVCWDSCVACAASAPTGNKNVTFTVDMSDYAGAFTTAYVSGSFNGWNGTSNPLTDMGNDVWSATLPIPVGFHEYKFTLDDWNAQENFTQGDPCTVTNFGFTNRFANISADVALAEVCWDSCDSCITTAPPTGLDTVDVTFQVDMSQYGLTVNDTVYVNGTFNTWCGPCIPLVNQGNDIWANTVPLIGDSAYEFKYTVNGWTDQENFVGGEPCTITQGGFTNRALNLGGNDTTLSLVCWDACDTCGAPVDTVAVTFQVDMSQFGGAFTNPELNGAFNGWCGNCAPMTDMGNGIWAITVDMVGNMSYEYKFSYDNWAGEEMFAGGEPCTITNFGFTNRLLSLGTTDTTLSVVCWESCSACVAAPPSAGQSAYCETFASHFATPNDTAQAVYLTIANTSDSTMVVSIYSANADSVDELIVTNGSGAMISGTDSSVAGTYSRTLTWTGTAPDSVQLNVLWSNTALAGNAQLWPTDSYVAFADTCPSATMPPSGPAESAYCQTFASHFATPNDTLQGVYLTIANTSDSSMIVSMQSANANALDELIVTNGSGAMISGIDSSIAGTWSRTLTWTGTAPDSVQLNVLWSNTALPGNAQLWPTDSYVAFADTCPSVVAPPVGPAQSAYCETFASHFATPNDTAQAVYLTIANTSDSTMIVSIYSANADSVDELIVTNGSGAMISGIDSSMAGIYSRTLTWSGTAPDSVQLNVLWSNTALPGNAQLWPTDSYVAFADTCPGPPPPPPVPDTVAVTFQVDMSMYGTAFNNVYLAGTFNGYDPDSTLMTDANLDDVWDVTLMLYADTAYEFKYVLDSGAVWEQFSGSDACAINTTGQWNRALQVTGDSTLLAVCWESCDTCGAMPPAPSDTVSVTFQVDMSFYPGGFTTPEVNGTFNGWCGNCAPMTDMGNGVWATTIDMVGDSAYEFKFSHDNWGGQENFNGGEPCTVTNFGFTNRSLNLGSNDTTLALVCWEACDTCSGTPPAPWDTVNVTFQVDMSLYATPFTDATLNGTFNGWCGACAPMTDQGNGVWELTVPMIADSMYEYKFTVDGWTDDEQFNGSETCTGPPAAFVNRVLNLGGNDTTLSLVCFNSCDTCGAVADTVDVTFQVDMSDYIGLFTEVDVNGSWNGWCGTCNPLTDQGNGLWTGTIAIPEGFYEFKYTVDGWTDEEMFTGAEPCVISLGGFNNRELVIDADTTLALVCWNSCEACPADSVFSVTALVTNDNCLDTLGAVNAFVSGGTDPYTYNWSNGGTTSGINNLAAGTYTVTVTDAMGQTTTANGTVTAPSAALSYSVSTVEPGQGQNNGLIDLTVAGGTAPYTYGWSNGEATEDIAGIPAGVYTFTVIDANGCILSDSVDLMVNGLAGLAVVQQYQLYPNPATQSVVLTAQLAEYQQGQVLVRDLHGRVLLAQAFSGSEIRTTLALESLEAGIYFVAIEVQGNATVRKLVVLD